jgi:hypothetical protein
VNDVARRSALAALDRARPAIARLDQSRHFEELAADLMESWSAVETALRSLVGGRTPPITSRPPPTWMRRETHSSSSNPG